MLVLNVLVCIATFGNSELILEKIMVQNRYLLIV